VSWRVPVASPDLGADEVAAVRAVVERGWVTQGPEVQGLEQGFARLVGVRHAVATSSGTGALHTALIALDVGRGDEVVTTPLSCIASANPILFQGARPVFADVEPDTYNLDPVRVEKVLTPRTKAILPVHLFGHPADVDPLLELAASRGIPVIEDCSQATGATYRGAPVGCRGRVGVFSLYANKIVTAAEGGIAVTDDDELAARMRAIRNFGQRPGEHFVHAYLGANYKLSDLHAAIGRAQLAKIGGYVDARRRTAAALAAALAGLAGSIERLPVERPWARAVPFAFHVLFRSVAAKVRAEAALREASVETRPFFSLIPAEAPYRALGYEPLDTPVAADIHPRGLYVSASPDLTEADIALIASVLSAVAREPGAGGL
jgi:perosamine synthetase